MQSNGSSPISFYDFSPKYLKFPTPATWTNEPNAKLDYIYEVYQISCCERASACQSGKIWQFGGVVLQSSVASIKLRLKQR